MLSIKENFIELQLSLFKGALYQTYLELHLQERLRDPVHYVALAKSFSFKPNALQRFLNATTSIGLTHRLDSSSYQDIPGKPTYSDEGIHVLYWLIDNAVPDLLEGNGGSTLPPLGTDGRSIQMINKACELRLLRRSEEGALSNLEELKPFLLRGGAEYIGPKMTHYQYVMHPMWSIKGLVGALQTGRSQWREIFGAEGNNPFEIYRSQPKLLDDFSRGLHSLTQADNFILAGMFHMDAHCILDVGGGSGAWALALLEHGTIRTAVDIYELPEAIPLLSSIFYSHARASEERVKFIPGSFFDDAKHPYLAGLTEEKRYDFISLGWILHDWDNERCLKILRKIKSHLKPTGELLILESLLPESRVSPVCIADISMLLQTEGCERTLSEYNTLLKEVGFSEATHTPTATRRQLLRAGLADRTTCASLEL